MAAIAPFTISAEDSLATAAEDILGHNPNDIGSASGAEPFWNFNSMKTGFEAKYTPVDGIAGNSADFFASKPGLTDAGNPRISVYFQDANGAGMTRLSDHWGDLKTSTAALNGASSEDFVMTGITHGHVNFNDIRMFGMTAFESSMGLIFLKP